MTITLTPAELQIMLDALRTFRSMPFDSVDAKALEARLLEIKLQELEHGN